MKVYYLYIPDASFTKVDNTWTSPTFDLYDNSSYTNYSVFRSTTGNNLLANSIWTGTRVVTETAGYTLTDTGKVENSRYIDYSGEINVVNFEVSIQTAGTAEVVPTMSVYTTADTGLQYPEEWNPLGSVELTGDMIESTAHRYAKFILDFDVQSGQTFTCDLFVRIEIDEPIALPVYDRTRAILNKFPSWMALREITESSATPGWEYPGSLGGKVINDISGEWLDDLYAQASYLELQKYIDTVDLNQTAWVYRSSDLPRIIYSITGDDIELIYTHSVEEFLTACQYNEDVVFWEERSFSVYTSKSYDSLKVNGVEQTQEVFQVWNYLDEIGLKVDLTRLHLEDNESFRTRIKDVYLNPLGVSRSAIQLALRRELSLWRFFEEGATPDSSALGATPSILEIEDIRNDSVYFAPDGLPTSRFVELSNRLARVSRTTWGEFFWDRARWDVGGPQHEGYYTVPYRLDATPLSNSYTQSGVGDDMDLFVHRPDVITGPYDYTLRLKSRGKQKVPVTLYNKIDFQVYVYGRADKKIYDNPIIDVNLTVEARVAGIDLFHTFTVEVQSDFEAGDTGPSDASYARYDLFDDGGYTNPAITWKKKSDGSIYASNAATPEGQVDVVDIEYMTIRSGHWNPSTQTYANKETSDTFSAWFGSNPDTVLEYDTESYATPSLPMLIGGAVFNDDFDRPAEDLSLGDSWIQVAGSWITDGSGRLQHSPGVAGLLIYDNESPQQHVEITSATELQFSGIVFRYVDASNYWRFYSNDLASTWMLQKFVNGTLSNVYTVSQTYFPKTDNQKLMVRAFGDNIYLYVDGTLIKTIVDSTHSTNGNGVGIMDSGVYPDVRIESFELLGQNLSDIYVSSKETSYTLGKWISEKSIVNVSINGLLPEMSVSDAVITPPVIAWDANLESIPNKELVVELITFSDSNETGAYTTGPDGNQLFLNNTHIQVNGTSAWDVNNILAFTHSDTLSLTFSSNTSLSYPVSGFKWISFEATSSQIISGRVDENGPWRNGSPSRLGNRSFIAHSLDIGRSYFSVLDSEDYIINWIGLEVLQNSDYVVAWLESNTVKPVNDSSLNYPTNVIVETLDEDSGNYIFNNIIVNVKLRSEIPQRWDPQIQSGTFFDKHKEYYLYASPITVYTNTNEAVLSQNPGLGAPMIIRTREDSPRMLRPVTFYDWTATPHYLTPTTLNTVNTEIVSGTGISGLFVGYDNVYNVSVRDKTIDAAIGASAYSVSNFISTSEVTNKTHTYEVSYMVALSYVADHDYLSGSNNVTKILFDSSPQKYGVSEYEIIYEGSRFNPTTTIDLPLSPQYTSVKDGFIYISHNEYTLDKVYVRMSPAKLLADGKDYAVLTLNSVDQFGNPKANQDFSLSTNWGLFKRTGYADSATADLTTDDDGYVSIILKSGLTPGSGTGQITVSGAVSTVISFDTKPSVQPEGRLIATVRSESLPADGASYNYVYGRVENADYSPVQYAQVFWKKGRSLSETFTSVATFGFGSTPSTLAGVVTTDDKGRFTIGPFLSSPVDEPGFWFVVAESTGTQATPSATPFATGNGTYGSGTYGSGTFGNNAYETGFVTSFATPVGDVVFWLEYPDLADAIDPSTQMPYRLIQDDRRPWDATPYANRSMFPSFYDENHAYGIATPITINWLPPKWYAIDTYQQYQMGLLGGVFEGYNDFILGRDSHPPTREA